MATTIAPVSEAHERYEEALRAYEVCNAQWMQTSAFDRAEWHRVRTELDRARARVDAAWMKFHNER